MVHVAARQVGCLFLEIFVTFFGIKSLNNLSFNKFKMARAASYQGEQYSSCNNGKYNKQVFSPQLFCSYGEPRIAPVSKKVTRIMHM